MKKVCIKPQCGNEYMEGDDGFEFDSCMICGAPLDIIGAREGNLEQPLDGEMNYTMEMDKNHIEMAMNNLSNIELKSSEVSSTIANEKIDEINNGSIEETALMNNLEILESLDISYDNENCEEIFEVDKHGYLYFINNREKSLNVPRIQIYEDDIIYNTIPLKYDEMFVGRAAININPDIDFSELDKGKIVSRKHGLIYRRNDGFYIKNIASRNSIEINGKLIPKDEERKINDGDNIVFSKKYLMKYVV